MSFKYNNTVILSQGEEHEKRFIEQVNKSNAKIIDLPEDKPQIIDLSNVEGVEMMVSDDNKDWVKAKVMAFKKDWYFSTNGKMWAYAKPILPKYTLKELQEILGHEFEIIKDLSNE